MRSSDWSSDVCSSDLLGPNGFPFTANPRNDSTLSYARGLCPTCERLQSGDLMLTAIMQPPQTLEDMDLFVEACAQVLDNRDALLQLGRASCRERVCQYV